MVKIETKEPIPHATFGDSDKVACGNLRIGAGQSAADSVFDEIEKEELYD